MGSVRERGAGLLAACRQFGRCHLGITIPDSVSFVSGHRFSDATNARMQKAPLGAGVKMPIPIRCLNQRLKAQPEGTASRIAKAMP